MSTLTKEQISDRIIRVTAEQFCIHKGRLKPDTRFTEDLGSDSLDDIEMVMAIEEEFEIEIRDEDAEKVKTIADAVELVARLLKVPA
jgi:acyl carrier protein